jgi:hypothetical protein
MQGLFSDLDPPGRSSQLPQHTLLRSKGLATHEQLRLSSVLILLHQSILRSGAFFPPLAFKCLSLPPARCVADHRHCDVEEAEAELCGGHDVSFPTAALVCYCTALTVCAEGACQPHIDQLASVPLWCE